MADNIPELKRNAVFVFCEGTLTLKLDGHGPANGWALLSFPEDQVEIEEGKVTVEIAPSELRELHQFLGKHRAEGQ